jgi:polyisoprenoid-binding protein YceI
MSLRNFFLVLFSVMALQTSAQKYASEKGVITFFSEAAIEDIKAENLKASSMLNTSTTDIAFVVPIREFQFEKKLMQEHFNEKYMESEKYPKATFSGKLDGFVNTDAAGVQQVKASGKLVIHGVTKEVEILGTLETTTQHILIRSKFIVRLEDHNIKIPQLMWQNIAEQVEVSVEFTYKPQ